MDHLLQPGRSDFLPISSELHRTRAPPVWRAHLPPCASGALASLMVCALATPSSSASFLGGGAESAAADRRRCGRVLLAGWQPKSGLVAICYAVIPLSTRPPTACCSTTRHANQGANGFEGTPPRRNPHETPVNSIIEPRIENVHHRSSFVQKKGTSCSPIHPPTGRGAHSLRWYAGLVAAQRGATWQRQ